MTTATKPKARPAGTKKGKPKASGAKKGSPRLFERLSKGLDDFRRHLAGEDVGVTTTVYVSPGAASRCVAAIKAAREAAGLTLAQVSARCKLRVGTLTRLERGSVPNPTVDTLARYAAAVGRVLTLGIEPMTHPPT